MKELYVIPTFQHFAPCLRIFGFHQTSSMVPALHVLSSLRALACFDENPTALLRSVPSIRIFAQIYSAGTDHCSNINRTNQRAYLRFAHATVASSQTGWYLLFFRPFLFFRVKFSYQYSCHTPIKSELQLTSEVRYRY